MGAHTIRVPDVGEGVAEVELVAWTVAVGDTVTRNQVLAEVMTDKANVEIPAPVDGVVADLNGEIGEILAVGSDLIRLTIDGDGERTADGEVIEAPAPTLVAPPVMAPSDRGVTLPFPQPRQRRSTAATAGAPSAPAPAAAASPPTSPGPGGSTSAATTATPTPTPAVPAAAPATGVVSANGARARAAPAVRRRARDLGVDLATVGGSGPAGRVTHADLDRLLTADPTRTDPGGADPHRSNADPGPDVPRGEPVVEPLVGLRRQIARRWLRVARNASTSVTSTSST
ncbi:MAG: biotin/lipoyl-containing protein [Actinomycetota bacterium]